MNLTEKERRQEANRLQELEAFTEKHGLGHSFATQGKSEHGLLTVDGYGGQVDEVYIIIEERLDITLSRTDAKALHDYLGRWLEARGEWDANEG